MADYSNFYNTGQLKWGQKTNKLADVSTPSNDQSNPPQPPSNIITELLATSIQTSVQKQSIKVVKGSNIVAMFMLSKIATWDLSGNQIIIYSRDQLPITLMFISIIEAQNADQRLTDAINGELLT